MARHSVVNPANHGMHLDVERGELGPIAFVMVSAVAGVVSH